MLNSLLKGWLRTIIVVVLGLSAVAVCPISGLASDYKIGFEDVLKVSFWQDPKLSAEVRVNLEGEIALDIVGLVEAAGKTVEELQAEIVRRMSRLNKNISQVVVRVAQYNYQHLFLIGQVNEAGKKTFEVIPDLWTILNESGGITEFGDLTRVAIIRGGDRSGEVEIVNVLAAVTGGGRDRLPKVRREDTIEIPKTPLGLPASEIGQRQGKKNVIYVLGAVNNPGSIEFEEGTDLMEALSLAGGNAPNADMKRARVITRDGNYAQTMEFNLEEFSKTGAIARYTLRREDTFILPQKGNSTWTYVMRIGAVIGIVSSAVLIYRIVGDDNGGI